MKVLMFLLLFSLSAGAEVQIELEHTIVVPEGSSWGTEDLLRGRLAIPEKDLPALFKLPRQNPAPKAVKVPKSSDQKRARIFLNDTIYLYRNMNVCLEDQFNPSSHGFQEGFNLFMSRVSGTDQKRRPFTIRFTSIPAAELDTMDLSKCDVIAYQGKKEAFPFNKLQGPSLSGGRSQVPEIVLGLFYKFSEGTVPVIVFNPDLQINFSADGGRYLTLDEKNKLQIDGRVLLFHELGHVLGFSHIEDADQYRPFSSMTVMGSENSRYRDEDVLVRFTYGLHIWRNWNLQQTSIYRSILWKWAAGESVEPGELNFRRPFQLNHICGLPGEDLVLNFTRLKVSGSSEVEGPLKELPGTVLLQAPEAKRVDKEFILWKYDLISKFYLYLFFDRNVGVEDVFAGKEFFANYENGEHYFSLAGKISATAKGQHEVSVSFVEPPRRALTYVRRFRLEVSDNPATCFR